MTNDFPPLGGMDLNLLTTLRVLLREESVTRAATRLGQTQPAVSRSLATLRVVFGDQLLVRRGRGMARTPFAEAIRVPLERALSSLDRLRALGDFDPTTTRRTFRILMPDIVGFTLLAPLTRLLAGFPGLDLQVFGSEKHALRMLLEDEIDLVLGAPPIEHAEFYSKVMHSDMSWSCLYGAPHPAYGRNLSYEEWLDSEHLQLVPEEQPRGSNPIDTILKQMGDERTIRVRVSYASAIGPILEATAFVSTLPTFAARTITRGHELHLCRHPLEDGLPELRLRMTWHASQHEDRGHMWLRDTLSEQLDLLMGTP